MVLRGGGRDGFEGRRGDGFEGEGEECHAGEPSVTSDQTLVPTTTLALHIQYIHTNSYPPVSSMERKYTCKGTS
jgi:hypothetical protein